MPITQFLGNSKFDPETRRIMGLAFEMTHLALGLADRGSLANEVIAKRIIELAKTGELNLREKIGSYLRAQKKIRGRVRGQGVRVAILGGHYARRAQYAPPRSIRLGRQNSNRGTNPGTATDEALPFNFCSLLKSIGLHPNRPAPRPDGLGSGPAAVRRLLRIHVAQTRMWL
jgi:hypothetical protein